jgi:hypothetical protein
VIAHFGDIGPTGNARVVGGYALPRGELPIDLII